MRKFGVLFGSKKRIPNAMFAKMSPGRELFNGLSDFEQKTWSQTRLAAYCGVSWETMHKWTDKPSNTIHLWTGRPSMNKKHV